MVIECLECGRPEVILTAKLDVDFRFDEKGDVVLITDIADKIYWGVVYDGMQAVCKCLVK